MKDKNLYGDLEFVFKEPQNFEGCTLLNGWHGIGECGFISMSHLVDKLGAERIGYIITSNIPQFITIKNNKITFPFEIYRRDDMVVILPIFEPIKSEHLIFTKSVVQWSIDQKFKQAVLIGGLDRRLQDEAEIKAIYTQAFRENRTDVEIPFLDEGLYVTGPLAYMLMFYELNDFEAIALLPYAERSRPDPVAASIAVKEINKILDIDVNVQELLDEAQKIEKEIESLLQASRSRKDSEKDSDEGMFV
ncbi:MAG: proteasome assembly chaperone family protein [Candidatus Heimdallarchaeota archaeon]|nr:proteasome assembly chaperone family protein [Candidatus Heimdallarchaeota archaeon]